MDFIRGEFERSSSLWLSGPSSADQQVLYKSIKLISGAEESIWVQTRGLLSFFPGTPKWGNESNHGVKSQSPKVRRGPGAPPKGRARGRAGIPQWGGRGHAASSQGRGRDGAVSCKAGRMP